MRNFLGGLLALLSICLASPAPAAYTITFDPGGVITEFYDKYTLIRQAGGKVIIDGPCISACTLVTNLIDNEDVCITPRAILGFHSASHGSEFSPDGTGLLWHQYPKVVRDFLISKGWDGTTAHPELIWMDNETLRTIYKTCPTHRNND
jgi:hypothetical protein